MRLLSQALLVALSALATVVNAAAIQTEDAGIATPIAKPTDPSTTYPSSLLAGDDTSLVKRETSTFTTLATVSATATPFGLLTRQDNKTDFCYDSTQGFYSRNDVHDRAVDYCNWLKGKTDVIAEGWTWENTYAIPEGSVMLSTTNWQCGDSPLVLGVGACISSFDQINTCSSSGGNGTNPGGRYALDGCVYSQIDFSPNSVKRDNATGSALISRGDLAGRGTTMDSDLVARAVKRCFPPTGPRFLSEGVSEAARSFCFGVWTEVAKQVIHAPPEGHTVVISIPTVSSGGTITFSIQHPYCGVDQTDFHADADLCLQGFEQIINYCRRPDPGGPNPGGIYSFDGCTYAEIDFVPNASSDSSTTSSITTGSSDAVAARVDSTTNLAERGITTEDSSVPVLTCFNSTYLGFSSASRGILQDGSTAFCSYYDKADDGNIQDHSSWVTLPDDLGKVTLSINRGSCPSIPNVDSQSCLTAFTDIISSCPSDGGDINFGGTYGFMDGCSYAEVVMALNPNLKDRDIATGNSSTLTCSDLTLPGFSAPSRDTLQDDSIAFCNGLSISDGGNIQTHMGDYEVAEGNVTFMIDHENCTMIPDFKIDSGYCGLAFENIISVCPSTGWYDLLDGCSYVQVMWSPWG